jgi:predicted transcriptional regulator of viral defense system
MKSSKNLLEQLKPLPYFSKDTIHQLGTQLGLKDNSIDTYISRFLKRREILQLKKGLYVAASFFDENGSDVSYSFYLANIIRKPSYVSLWTALQYYNLTTEAIQIITSVTPKATRTYNTKVGNFTYQSIKRGLFSDFSLIKGKFDFFIASPSKALFDLLYFKTHQFRGVRLEDVKSLVEDLRIDIEEVDKEEQAKFYAMISKYLHHE